MSSTDQVATRDRERTRRALLDAAERLLGERGTGASLASVAEAAGVSKSGLLHHFPSRDSLLLAVAEHGLIRLREEVDQHTDADDDRPGASLRGYVRALCGGSARAVELFAPSPLWNGLLAVPGIEALLHRDAEHWRRALAADGLPAGRVLVVRHAAEGLAAASALPAYLRADELSAARTALLALTEP